ncbi:MAG: DUF6173 family protein [Geobacteraceae bacterium]|nr:DUF6173 family protein [Geobacteraceae bacterium]
MTEYSIAVPPISGFDHMNRMQAEICEAAQASKSSAVGVFKAIREYVEQFEAELGGCQEVAMRLASFGEEIDFRPEKIGYSVPDFITFVGVTDGGEKVHLVQHVSQLSFLLRAADKLGDLPTRIVFAPAGPQKALKSLCAGL